MGVLYNDSLVATSAAECMVQYLRFRISHENGLTRRAGNILPLARTNVDWNNRVIQRGNPCLDLLRATVDNLVSTNVERATTRVFVKEANKLVGSTVNFE